MVPRAARGAHPDHGPSLEGVDPARVLATVRRLTAEPMDVDPGLVQPDSRFADLGF